MTERRFLDVPGAWCTSDDRTTWTVEQGSGDRMQIWFSASEVYALHRQLRISVEERLELLDEVKDGEERQAALTAQVEELVDAHRRDGKTIARLRRALDAALDSNRSLRTALAPPGSAPGAPQLNRFSGGVQ